MCVCVFEVHFLFSLQKTYSISYETETFNGTSGFVLQLAEIGIDRSDGSFNLKFVSTYSMRLVRIRNQGHFVVTSRLTC